MILRTVPATDKQQKFFEERAKRVDEALQKFLQEKNKENQSKSK